MTAVIENIRIFVEYLGIWFIDNWVTVVSIILSGVISWIISTIYYHKANRNNLQMTIIFPVIRLLEEEYSIKNYNILCDLSKDYCAKYMNKKEKRLLAQLISSYKEISNYRTIDVNATILFSYFEYVLEKNNIEVKPVPIEYQGEIVYYDYPQDLRYLDVDLKQILKEYDPDFQPEECKEAIISLFSHYCRKYYTDTRLIYFNDYDLDEVLSQSQIRSRWDNKFSEMNKIKNQFVDLKIVKGIIGE